MTNEAYTIIMQRQEESILRLVAQQRQMDQLIFRMSQCNSWNGMQPLFAELLAGTMQRMREESDRIRTLMIPQIRETYLNAAPQTDRTEPPRARLEGPRDACDKDTEGSD